MTKGWSVWLLFALILLAFARYFLHVGGFWDLAPLRALQRRWPQLAMLLSVASLRDLPDLLPDLRHPVATAALWAVRGVLLICALVLAAAAALAVVTAFVGGPL